MNSAKAEATEESDYVTIISRIKAKLGEGGFEEIDKLAADFGRDPGVISWPEKDIKRLMADDDWDFGPNIKARAQHVLDTEDLPEYPPEVLETFRTIMAEHGIDTTKLLPDA